VLSHSLQALDLLLQAGYDVAVKSRAGWTVLEEAVTLGDLPLVRRLIVATHEQQLRLWRAKKPVLLHALAAMPDFQMQLCWEFGSPVLSPILRQLAPSDQYTIYKVGSRLRIDASIVGFEGTRWVRGNVSLRFDGSRADGELSIVNHDERRVFVKEAGTLGGGMEGESVEEEAAFLLSSEMVQLSVRTANSAFEPLRMRLRDGVKIEQVGAWRSTVYSASTDLEIERRTKTGRVRPLPPTFAEYLSEPREAEAAAGRAGGRLGRRKPRPRADSSQSVEEEVQLLRRKATVSRRQPATRNPQRALRQCTLRQCSRRSGAPPCERGAAARVALRVCVPDCPPTDVLSAD
jgi:hypothetical protein